MFVIDHGNLILVGIRNDTPLGRKRRRSMHDHEARRCINSKKCLFDAVCGRISTLLYRLRVVMRLASEINSRDARYWIEEPHSLVICESTSWLSRSNGRGCRHVFLGSKRVSIVAVAVMMSICKQDRIVICGRVHYCDRNLLPTLHAGGCAQLLHVSSVYGQSLWSLLINSACHRIVVRLVIGQ